MGRKGILLGEPEEQRLPGQEVAQEVTTLDPGENTPAKSAFKETLIHLRYLLEEGAVSEARALVQEAQQRWPDSPHVQRWARLLDSPQARVHEGTGGLSRLQEYDWLREHAHEYPAQWLALLGDTLIISDADLTRVLETIRRTGRARDMLLHFQPVESWPQ